MIKKSLILACSVVALLSIGYAENNATSSETEAASSVSEKELGLRKTDLYSEGAETVGDKTKYGKAAAGTSSKIERAFTNAPPMIPHDVEGMLPITIKTTSV